MPELGKTPQMCTASASLRHGLAEHGSRPWRLFPSRPERVKAAIPVEWGWVGERGNMSAGLIRAFAVWRGFCFQFVRPVGYCRERPAGPGAPADCLTCSPARAGGRCVISLPSTVAPPGAQRIMLTVSRVVVSGATVYDASGFRAALCGLPRRRDLAAGFDLRPGAAHHGEVRGGGLCAVARGGAAAELPAGAGR